MKYTQIRILTILLFISTLTFSQQLKIFGTSRPGDLQFGIAKNAKTIMLDNRKLKFNNNGVFIFGFDRDAKGTHTLKIIFKDKKSITKKIKLNKRKYKIQRINRMKQSLVTPPKKAKRKIKQERIMMKNARAKLGEFDTPKFAQGFIRPVKGGKYTGIFGSQRILNGIPKSPHSGLDINVPRGTPVRATADGKILIAGNKFYYNGNFVLIDHGFGLTTVYLHFNKLKVKSGQLVKQGDIIGYVGATGRATGPHLHWGAKWYNKRIDPKSLLKLKYPNNFKN